MKLSLKDTSKWLSNQPLLFFLSSYYVYRQTFPFNFLERPISMIKRIYLADDDEDDAFLFKDVLDGLNKKVQLTIAVDGLKLIALLEQADTLPDLIFTDLNMPLKNGFQCLQEIRSRPEWNAIKVIIHSTTSQQSQIDKAYELGADFYLPKLADYRQFESALIKCLEMDWQQDSLK